MSKTCCYENPYGITGTVKHTGLQGSSKDICKDRFIGTREADDDSVCWESITNINISESDATTYEALVMRVEEQALVGNFYNFEELTNVVYGYDKENYHPIKDGDAYVALQKDQKLRILRYV